MLRALSTKRGCHGYDRLVSDTHQPSDEADVEDARLMRARSVPTRVFGSSTKPTPDSDFPGAPRPNPHPKKQSKAKDTNIKTSTAHPLFSLFDGSYWRKKKKKNHHIKRKDMTTANPEFARYLEYVKEGGVWDKDSNTPVIYYR